MAAFIPNIVRSPIPIPAQVLLLLPFDSTPRPASCILFLQTHLDLPLPFGAEKHMLSCKLLFFSVKYFGNAQLPQLILLQTKRTSFSFSFRALPGPLHYPAHRNTNKPADITSYVTRCTWSSISNSRIDAHYFYIHSCDNRPNRVLVLHLPKILLDCCRIEPRMYCELFVRPAPIESMMDRFLKVTHSPLNHRKSSLFNSSLRLKDLSFQN